MNLRESATYRSVAKVGVDVEDVLLKVKDAMRYLNVGKSSFHKMRQQGLLPAAIMLGSSPRWHKADLDEWLDSQREVKQPRR